MSIDVKAPFVPIAPQPLVLSAGRPSTSVTPGEDLDIRAKTNRYSIVGDALFASVNTDEAPTWLTSIIDNVLNIQLGDALWDLDSLKANLHTALDEIDVAKNTYQESIISLQTIDEHITGRLSTLNANMATANAQIVELGLTRVTEEQAEAIAAERIEASLLDGDIRSTIDNVRLVISDLENTTAVQYDTLRSTIRGVGDAVSELELTSSVLDNRLSAAFEYNATLKLENGEYYRSGFGLNSSVKVDGSGTVTDPYSSEFWINAQRLKFTNTNRTGTVTPFTIDATGPVPQITFEGNVVIGNRGDAIEGGIPRFLGEFDSAPEGIVRGDTYKNSSDGVIYMWDGSDWVSTSGADGASAKAVQLVATSQGIKYSSSGTNPSPSLITLTATPVNAAGTVRYRFYVDGSTDGITTSNVFNYSAPADIGDAPVSILVELLEDDKVVAEDSVSIYSLRDGASAVTVIFSNPVHAVPAEPDGSSPDLDNSGTTIKVFQGADLLVFAGAVSDSPTENSTYTLTLDAPGLGTPTISGKDTTMVTVADWPFMTVDKGTATYEFKIRDREGNLLVLDETTSIVKVRRGREGIDGADGSDGSDGTNARAVSLSVSKQAIKYDTTGKNPSPSSITCSAQAQNTTGLVRYLFFVNDEAQGTPSASNTFTYNVPDTLSEEAVSIEVELHEDGVIKARDEVNIYGLRDGHDALSVVISNRVHTVPAEEDGSSPDLEGSGTTIKVFQGIEPLTFRGVSDTTPNASSSFNLYRIPVNLNDSAISGTGTSAAVVADYSSMTQDKASAIYEIYVRDSEGNPIRLDEITSFSKSRKGIKGTDGKDGQDGVDGADGADGSDGANARAVSLTVSKQAIKYDTAGHNPNPETITCSAEAQNTSGAVRYLFFVNDEAQGSPSASNTFSYTVPSTLFEEAISIEVELHEDGVIKARDEVNLYGLRDGHDAINAVISNRVHTVPADEDGSSPDLEGSGTTIRVFQGIEALTFRGSSDTFPSANSSFNLYRVPVDLNSSSITGTGTSIANVADYSQMTKDKASAIYEIYVRDSEGNTVVLDEITSFSKSRKGVDGTDGSDGRDGIDGADGQDGSDGINARAVSLSVTKQAIKYSTAGIDPTPASVTFSATPQNTVGDVEYRFYVNDEAQGEASVSNSFTYEAPAGIFDEAISVEVELIEDGAVKARDEVNLYGLRDGHDAINVLISNRVHTVPAESNGTNPDLDGSGTTIQIFQGTKPLRFGQVSDSTPTHNLSFNLVRTTSGLNNSSISGTGTTTATIADYSSMTVDKAIAEYKLIIRDEEGGLITLNETTSFSKSRRGQDGKHGVDGADGEDGSDGVNARSVILTASKQAIKYSTAGDSPTPDSVTFTAQSFNTEGSVQYRFFVDDVVQGDPSSNNTFTYSTPSKIFDEAVSVEVELIENGVIKARDEVNIYGLRDGHGAINVLVSNRAHTVPANANGSNPDLEGSGTTIKVFQGTKQLKFNAVSSSNPSSDSSFNLVRATSGLNNSTITGTGSTVATIADYTSMTVDKAFAEYTVIVRDEDGTIVTLNELTTFSKSRQGNAGRDGTDGTDGVDGADGKDGSDGTSSRAVHLSASKQAIKYDSAGEAPNPDSVTFTAQSYNTEGAVQYRFFVNDSPQGNPSSSNTFELDVPNTIFDEAISVEVELIEDGITKARDEVNIYGLRDGHDAISVLVSNRAHTVPSEADGSNPDLSGSGTDIRVFQGIEPLTFNTVSSSNPAPSASFNISRSVSGLNSPSITGQGTTTATVADYSSMTRDKASAEYVITVRDKDGKIATFTEVSSLSKSRKGDAGRDGEDGKDGIDGIDGTDGDAGFNQATLFAYRRSSSRPSNNPGTVTYTFAQPDSWQPANSWRRSIPDDNGQPLWVTVASAASRQDSISVQSSQWSEVVKLAEDGTDGVDGDDGSDGIDGLNTATVFLYRRTARSTTPSGPTNSSSVVYDFDAGRITSGSPGNQWVVEPPTSSSPVLWMVSATASSRTNTDTIAGTEWSSPKVLTIDGVNGVDGADGEDGSDGANARAVHLAASRQAIKYNTAGKLPSPSSVTFTATPYNTSGAVQYRFYVNDTAQGGPSSSNTFTYSVPANIFNQAISIEVELLEAGVVKARDEVNLYGLQDGHDAFSVVVSNRAHTVPSDANGGSLDMAGSGTTIRVFQGTTPVTFNASSSNYPSSGPSFNIDRTVIGLNSSAISGQGTTEAVIADYSSMSQDKASAVYAIRVRDSVGDTLRFDETTSFSKSRRGQDGRDGVDGDDGVPGPPGKDGKIYYTWIRYADNADGGGISNSPVGKDYIGFAYNKETSSESDNPDDYQWSLFRGENGTDGVPGAPGKDGETTYTWIAYSANPDGNPMHQVPGDSSRYIGIAVNKSTAAESSNPNDYVWSLFRGADGKDGVDGADGTDGSDGASARAVKLTASRQAIKYDSAGRAPSPSSITFTAQAQNTTDSVRYRFFVNDAAQGSAGTSNTFTYPVPSSLPNEPISVEVELHEGGVIKARDEVTVYGLKDGSSAVSVIISNQAHTVPADSNGGNPNLTGSGTDIQVFQGTTPLIFDGLQTGHPSQRGRFRIGISSSTGMSFPVASGVGTDTATIGDYTAMTVDLATVDLRIRAVTDEGEALTIPEVLSYSKSRRGADGKDGKNGVDGADGADGSDGANARAVHLSATRQAVKYNTAGSNPTPSTITFTAQAQNTTGSVRYRFFVNNSAQGSASTSNTFTYPVPSSLPNEPISVEVELHEDGVIKARDEVSVYGIQDGTNAISVVVSNQAHTVPANADGSNPDLTGSGTTIKVFEGSTPLVYDGVSTSYPSLPRRFSITRTSDGMSTANLSGSGTTTATVADYTTMWGSRDKTSVTFTIRVRNSAGEDVEPITAVTTFSKSRRGADGRDGQSTYKSVVYRRSATKPSRPPNSIAAGGSYENPVPAFWSASLPADNGQPGWQSTRIFTSDGRSPQEPEWSEPQQITGDDGTPGAPGTGFYSAQYDSLNWGVARGRFRDLVGRWPIPGDVFTMSLANGNSETRKRNEADDSWVAPGIMLHGDMFATGTVGARVLSADAVNGRVIHGSLYITSTPSSEYFEVQGILPNSTAFGAQNNLYMWYGRKTSQTWNSSTNEPRLNGLTTLNSIEHKTVNGDRFFGGTFQAGTLSLSRQTTNSSGQMIVDTGAFTIPGNTTTLSIAASLSASGRGVGTGQCPTNLSNVPVTIDIERLSGSNWVPIGGDNAPGQVTCLTLGGGEHEMRYNGDLTATTQLSVIAGQSLTLRAVGRAAGFPFTEGNTTMQGSRSLSIAIAGN